MIIGIAILLFIHLIFWIIPFIDYKKQRYIFIGSIVISLILIVLQPFDWLWGIKLPIINNTIDNFAINFMQTSGLYNDLLTIVPGFEIEILATLKGIIKGIIVCIILSIIYMITALVLYIINVTKIKEKIAINTIGFICVLFAGIIMIISPLAAVNDMKLYVNENVARKGEILTETYNYDKYQGFIDTINFLGINSPVSEVTSGVVNLFTFNKFNILKSELYNIDKYLLEFQETGATIIYTDKDFNFSKTKKDTFNFEAFKDLISKTLNSRWYKDAALIFANQIMTCFEERIAYDVNIDRSTVNLQYTAKEFSEQYTDLMDMLAFVVDNNLVDKTRNFDLDKLIDLALDLGLDKSIQVLFGISNSPIINKINTYVKKGDSISKSVYACVRLYDVLNDWLVKYRQTSLYYTITTFLTFRGIIEVENI